MYFNIVNINMTRDLPCNSIFVNIRYSLFAKVSFALGQVKDPTDPQYPQGVRKTSFLFPPHLALDYLYPETSVRYMQDDGIFLDVPCFTPGVGGVQKVACPFPFVNPLADDHLESCIQPCPVQAYTDDEYTLMWGFSNGIGVVGLSLNVFMVATWTIGGRKHFSALPYQLKVCVFAGIAYGLVGTLPSLIMKYELPCACETEEWYIPCFSDTQPSLSCACPLRAETPSCMYPAWGTY